MNAEERRIMTKAKTDSFEVPGETIVFSAFLCVYRRLSAVNGLRAWWGIALNVNDAEGVC